MYFPLYTRSNASFLEGASHPEELVEEAHRLGLPGIALTDRNGLYGAVRAHAAARQHGIQLVLGAEVRVAPDSETDSGERGEPAPDSGERREQAPDSGERREQAPDSGERREQAPAGDILLLARNRTGYRNLCRLLTRGLLRGPRPPGANSSRKGAAGVFWREIAEHADGLHALWGGGNSALDGACSPDLPAQLLRDAFPGRFHLLLTRHRRAEDIPAEARRRELAERYRAPVAAAVEVLYHRPGRRDLQDVMTAIRHRTPLAKAGRRLRGNAEHALLSPAAFGERFDDDPAAVAATLEIAESCRFSLDEIRYRYPAEKTPDGLDSAERLRQLTLRGAADRYPEGIPEDVRRQLDRELRLIGELDYGGYFLTMHRIVRFCRKRAILCQGRGSAANSAVCYCLGITAVDPVRMGLLFERFLSRERDEPPDIDLDIMHSRREEVIRFVYRRYGEGRAAMVANTVCYRTRSAIRDVGKALGFAERAVDRLARQFTHHEPLSGERFLGAGWSPEHPAVHHLIRLAGEIQGFPRHLSIHPGGFLLGEEPVSHLVPVENAAMEGRTVIQWNKDDIEEMRLFKVDLLALGALTHLDLCFRLLREHRGLDLSMATVPTEDPETFAMIRRAETVGVFQIESRAQMAMLPRLRPETWYDLVIQVSIVRPGPISGGMVHPYLRRRRGEEPVEYPHPSLRPVLEKTLGVPLFQEQVMRLAVVAADYTPGEADQLRRDMAAWRRTGRMDRHRARLLSRMVAKGISPEFAERIFRQIQGFGEYGFPESHAASFALVSYVGAYLLRHYPAEFACALLNAQPMGFYSPSTIVEDMKRRGVRFLPVDVVTSGWDCSLVPEEDEDGVPAVRMGLRYVKGLGAGDGERILAARGEAEFRSVDDLARRTGLAKKPLLALAEADGFRSLGPRGRREAVWAALGAARLPGAPSLGLPEADARFRALDSLQSIGWDHRTKSHSTRGHPLEPLRPRLAAAGLPTARELNALPHEARARYAGLVICRQRPGTASGVVFMTLEDETGFVNLVLWPRVFERWGGIVRTESFLGAAGRMESQDGAVHLVVDRLFRPELPGASPAPRVPSRDFH